MSSRARWKEGIPLYLGLALILLFFALPLLWLLSLSVRTPAEILVAEVRIVPHSPTLQNFVEVLRNRQFLGYLWNGTKLSLIGAAVACAAAAPASYAFSRFQFRGKTQLLFAVLGFQMISPLVIMVPLYRYMQALGLTESHLGAALVYAAVAAPIATWTLKGSFDAIPRELEEAAMMDGCSRAQAFLRIILPIGLPGLASTFILVAMLGVVSIHRPVHPAQPTRDVADLRRHLQLPGRLHGFGDATGGGREHPVAASGRRRLPRPAKIRRRCLDGRCVEGMTLHAARTFSDTGLRSAPA